MNTEFELFGWTFGMACVITLLTLAIAMMFGASIPSGLEMLAVMTSYGSTLLFVLQRRQCYLWGAVTTLLYAALFWDDAPASARVQLYLLGALVYGYWRWGPDGNPRPVSTVDPYLYWFTYIGVTALTFSGAAILSHLWGAPLAGWDAAIMALSILAQWLLDNKKIETWAVWAVVNVIAIPYYASLGWTLVSIQYFVFLLNAGWGAYLWWVSMIERRSDVQPFTGAVR